MLIGPAGERAILDLVEGGIIEDDKDMSGIWGAFLDDLGRKAEYGSQLAEDVIVEDFGTEPD